MGMGNGETHYGWLAKSFHWIIAILIFGLICVGFYMESMPNSPQKFEIYGLHKSFGLMVLWLAGLRLIWRHISKPPRALDTHQRWEKILSKITHILLYIAMISMPLSGWLMSSAGEYPVSFFGLQMPALTDKNPALAGLMNSAHSYLAYCLIAAIFLHSAGAIKHHIIDGDITLKRMVPSRLFVLWQFVILVALIILALVVIKLGILNKLSGFGEQAEIQEVVTKQPEPKPRVNENIWRIVKEQSSIQFSSSVYQTPFTANFNDFDGKIVFDPNDLTGSSADIRINLKSVDSGDANRDAQMMGGEWFNVADGAYAQYRITQFEKGTNNTYIAIGDLTLAKKTMPVILPFTLDIAEVNQENRAFMEATVKLNRLDFDLGAGQWVDKDSVEHEVDVRIKLVAAN